MRVLHLSTWNDQCGIGDYVQNLVAALQRQPHVTADVYPPRQKPTVLMSQGALRRLFEGFLVLASAADVVHIQHHLAFFAARHGFARSVLHFSWLLMQLRLRGMPIVTTFHEPLGASPSGGLAAAGSVRGRIERDWQLSLWRWNVARHFRRGGARRQAVVHTQTIGRR